LVFTGKLILKPFLINLPQPRKYTPNPPSPVKLNIVAAAEIFERNTDCYGARRGAG